MKFKQRFLVIERELVVEISVVLILQSRRLFAPDRTLLVDRFGAASEENGVGDEVAVFANDFAQAIFLSKFLRILFEVDYDGRAAVGFLSRLDGKGFFIPRNPAGSRAVRVVACLLYTSRCV